MSYLIEVVLFQALAVILYRLFWYRSYRLGWNRSILIGIIVLSLIVPLISFTTPVEIQLYFEPEAWVAEGITKVTTYSRIESSFQVDLSLPDLLQISYLSMALLLLARYTFSITKLILHDKEIIDSPLGKMYSTSYPYAYSFFNRIHIPDQWRDHDYLEMIVLHEQQHVKLGHSWDRLLLELVTVLFWFNPFTHLLKKYLIEVHEFEADHETVVSCDNPLRYQWLLLDQLSFPNHAGLVSYFAFSNTKRRIHMINNTKSNRWKYLLVFPVIGTLTTIFGFEQKQQELLPWTPIDASTFVFPALPTPYTDQDDQMIPSILPLKIEGDQIKVTSGWGERRDPFSNKMRHHFGVDFKAERGTPVIATAAGKVTEVRHQPDGYGHYVMIEHGSGFKTRYAQLENSMVLEGQKVSQGQVIGQVGSSGRSTAPHLHYEVYIDEKRVDPGRYIGDFATE